MKNGAMSLFNLSASLSGLSTSALRLQVSADNVARRPVKNSEKNRVVQSEMQIDGVKADVQKISFSEEMKTSSSEYHVSNIDYAEESIQQILARTAFEANLAVAKKQIEMTDSLIDMKI